MFCIVAALTVSFSPGLRSYGAGLQVHLYNKEMKTAEARSSIVQNGVFGFKSLNVIWMLGGLHYVQNLKLCIFPFAESLNSFLLSFSADFGCRRGQGRVPTVSLLITFIIPQCLRGESLVAFPCNICMAIL